MSVDFEDETLKSDSDVIYSDYIEYARITFGNENAYFMKTEKITIGRNSADGTVDIDVGPHTFVSRKHLEMMYSYKKLKIKCLGKNGIFIDNYFKAHSAIPYELPYECTLRFPSTNVELNVKQLVGRQSDKCNFRESDNDTNDFIDTRTLVNNRKRKATQKINENFSYDIFESVNTTNKEITINNFDIVPSRRPMEMKREQSDSNMKSDLDRTMVESVIHNSSATVDNSPPNYNNHNNNIVTHHRKPVNSTTVISATCTTALSPKLEQQIPSIINSSHNLTTQTSTVSTGKKFQNVCIEKSNSIPQIILNARPYRSYSYKGEVIYTHNSQVFSSIYDSKDLAIEYGTDTQKPPYSYAQLIVQAVSSSRDRQLTLNGIYNYISKHYPYFKSHDKGWQNSVRHNLSLNRYFIKVPRGQDEPGKGSFWRVDGAYESKLIAQAFRKRRLRSNNCGSICSENIPSASRVFSLSSGRAGSLCAVSDRNAKLNNIFTLRRAGDQKAATTYVLRKMSDTQQLTENVFGSPKLISKQSDVNNSINKISPDNVFHTNHNSNSNSNINSKSNTSSKLGQKRIFQQPISMINKPPSSTNSNANNSNSNTIFSIGGKVFSTNKLKPIQLLSTKNSASFLSVKQQSPQQQQQQNSNKYILISTSQIDNPSSQNSRNNSHSNQMISITGSGTLNRHQESDHHSDHQIRSPNKPPSIHPIILSDAQLDLAHYKLAQQPISPLSVSETCEFPLDEPSQLDSSSTELGPLSPGIKFTQSLQHEDDDDDLDLEMDQFLDSYSILDHSNDIDSPADLYKEAATEIDDYCVWQDECLGLQDVEIEIH